MTIVSSANFFYWPWILLCHISASQHLKERDVTTLRTFLTGDKRPRDGSRGHKDRVRGAGKEHDRGTESSRSKHRIEREKEREEVSRTVIIKGLPSHTTEPTVRNLYLHLISSYKERHWIMRSVVCEADWIMYFVFPFPHKSDLWSTRPIFAPRNSSHRWTGVKHAE